MQGIAHSMPQRMAVLGGGVLRSFIFFPHCFQFFGGIEGIVGVTIFDQLLRVFGIYAESLAFALAIGAVFSFFVRAFIGVEAAPFQGVDDIFFGAGDITALVGIFDTKDEVTAMAAGKKVVVEYCTYAAQVEATGGAG